MRTFFVLWFGQFISMMGTGLTGFALSVYVFTANRSVTEFALILLANQLPGMLISPFAGALVDRWNRKWILVASDSLSAVFTVILLIRLHVGGLEIWHVYLLTLGISTLNAFQMPAYTASITVLVPKSQLSRAAGMGQLSTAVSQIFTPFLGGALLGVLQLRGILLIDIATFLVATATLVACTIPKAKESEAGKEARGSLWQEALYGWHYIRRRKGLMALMLFFATTNFLTGLVTVLATPMILSFASEKTLGILLTTGGIGMLAGSLVVTSYVPKRMIWGILGGQAIAALALCFAGLRESVVLLGVCFFAYLFANPVVMSFSQAIWQRKVPADTQGKVFAMRRLVSWSMLPLAYLLAGPLSDRLFEPWMAEGGALASTVGTLIGVGPGRGMGLMFTLMGGLTLLVTLLAAARPELRRLELDLEDAQ